MEKETNEMNDESGYPTTPKLLQLLEKHAAGEDVLSGLVAYAKKGYLGAEEAVISEAEAGNQLARSTLTTMLITESNCLDPDQTRRAFASCDLESGPKRDVLRKKANKGEKWAVELLKALDPPPKEHID